MVWPLRVTFRQQSQLFQNFPFGRTSSLAAGEWEGAFCRRRTLPRTWFDGVVYGDGKMLPPRFGPSLAGAMPVSTRSWVATLGNWGAPQVMGEASLRSSYYGRRNQVRVSINCFRRLSTDRQFAVRRLLISNMILLLNFGRDVLNNRRWKSSTNKRFPSHTSSHLASHTPVTPGRIALHDSRNSNRPVYNS